jgi:hypothetical protein
LTQTYYLTLELSYPEFKAPTKNQTIYNTRGGYYKKWLGHANEQAEQSKPYRAPNPGPATSNYHADRNENEEEDEEPVPAAEADDDNMEIDPSLMNQTLEMDVARQEQEQEQQQQQQGDRREQEKGNGRKNEAEEPGPEAIENIQILDLHSHRPIISYRGRVFEGQWAEVIGTEMILADRDTDKAELPALRNLSGDVDLLAASASKILTTEKVLKPKKPEQDSLAEINKEWLINIPRGIDRTGERSQQANFLERLIALKLKKGESDHVTVYSKEAIGKDFRDHRDPDVRTRRKKTMDPDAELDDDGQPIRKRRRARRNMDSPSRHQLGGRGSGHHQTLPASAPLRGEAVGAESEEENGHRHREHHRRNDQDDDQQDDVSENSDEMDEDGSGMNDTDDMSQGSAGNQPTDGDDDGEGEGEGEDEDLDDYDNRHDKGKRVAWRT